VKEAVAKALAGKTHGTLLVAISLVASALLSVAIGWALVRNISRPVEEVTDVMRRLTRREFDIAIAGQGRRDEIGEMVRSIGVLKESMVRAVQMAADQERARGARSRRQDLMDAGTTEFGTSVSAVMGPFGTLRSRCVKRPK
jgi:methyl-accepting chemotaxis protein